MEFNIKYKANMLLKVLKPFKKENMSCISSGPL